MAFAPDGLTSVGGYPGDDEKGGAAVRKVDRAKMTEDFVAAADWLKARPDCTGKIGVGRVLLRRRHRQHAGGADGRRPRGRGAVLRRAAAGGGRAEDQGASSCTTASMDTRLGGGWPAYEAALKANEVPVRGLHLPKARSTAFTTTRRRATTRPRPSSPGSARSPGSTNTCEANRPMPELTRRLNLPTQAQRIRIGA